MNHSGYADISFFNAVCRSGAGSFIWNGDTKSGGIGTLFGWGTAKKTKASKDNSQSDSAPKDGGKKESVTSKSISRESSESLRSKGLGKSKSRLKKAMLHAAALPLLFPIGGSLETGITHLTNPQEARQRFDEQSLGENIRDFTLYNDLYQMATHDNGMVRFFEYVRRLVEAGVTGDYLVELLAAAREHRKNKKNTEKGRGYEKKAQKMSADEYMLAADLKEQHEAEMNLLTSQYEQKILEQQKMIQMLQKQRDEQTKKMLFDDAKKNPFVRF